MINESQLWKDELLRIAIRLEKRYSQKRWSERSFFVLEKDLFLGFFIIRKLIESRKVSASVVNKFVSLSAYPATDKKVKLLNEHKLSELFNLMSVTSNSLNVTEVCNQFIHSLIFTPFIPFGEALVGVFVASDYASKKMLYYITLVKIVEIFRSVGANYPCAMSVLFDEVKKMYVIELE